MTKLEVSDCRKAADQYCAYYATTLRTYSECGRDPYWREMAEVAELWRELLAAPGDDPRIHTLEAMLAAKWSDEHCGTTWVTMASSIDVWLRSIGRRGIGKNPWFETGELANVMLLY